MQSSSYIVFSLQTDARLVQRWQAALDDMRNDGSLARLHEQWLPNVALPAPPAHN
jgi:polar amino acid transport system substrate-binding protein